MSSEPSMDARTVLTGRKRWAALLFLALGVAMIILDATVVNVALPSMIKDLGLTTNDAEWINAAYSLTFASLLILSGRLADLFGRRLMFVIGVIVFVSASALVAASDTSMTIIGARALQGVGGAMILPASLSVINAVFVGKSRSVAFAVWGGTIGGMAAVGPLVGGWLTTNASWHWAFLINVPIGIIVIIGAFLTVPETKDTTGRRGIDVPGTVLVTLGLFGVQGRTLHLAGRHRFHRARRGDHRRRRPRRTAVPGEEPPCRRQDRHRRPSPVPDPQLRGRKCRSRGRELW